MSKVGAKLKFQSESQPPKPSSEADALGKGLSATPGSNTTGNPTQRSLTSEAGT